MEILGEDCLSEIIRHLPATAVLDLSHTCKSLWGDAVWDHVREIAILDDVRSSTKHEIFACGGYHARKYCLNDDFLLGKALSLRFKRVCSFALVPFEEQLVDALPLLRRLGPQLVKLKWHVLQPTEGVELRLDPKRFEELDTSGAHLELPKGHQWVKLKKLSLFFDQMRGLQRLPDAPNVEEISMRRAEAIVKSPMEMWPELRTKYPKAKKLMLHDPNWLLMPVSLNSKNHERFAAECLAHFGFPICDIYTECGMLWIDIAHHSIPCPRAFLDSCHSTAPLDQIALSFATLLKRASETSNVEMLSFIDTEFVHVLRTKRPKSSCTELVHPTVLKTIMQIQAVYCQLKSKIDDPDMRKARFWFGEFVDLAPLLCTDISSLFPWDDDHELDGLIARWFESTNFFYKNDAFQTSSSIVLVDALVPVVQEWMCGCDPGKENIPGPYAFVAIMHGMCSYPSFSWLKQADYTFGHSLLSYETHWFLRCNRPKTEWRQLVPLLRGARERQDKFVVGDAPNATQVVMEYIISNDASLAELADLTVHCFADSVEFSYDYLDIILKNPEATQKLFHFYELWFSVWEHVPLHDSYSLGRNVESVFKLPSAKPHLEKLQAIASKLKKHPVKDYY